MTAQFIQIAVSREGLFALDATGGVWRYIPGDSGHYSFWTKLTNYRRDPADKTEASK